jgi:hypothetical protein
VGPPGARFAPRPLPADDAAAYVAQAITSAPYRYQARILFHASVEDLADRTSPAAGRLEPAGPDACILHTGSNSLDELALFVGLKGFDFQVLDPPELAPALRSLSGRLRRAADASLRAAQPADVHDGHARPARYQPGQMRHIGGNDQNRCHPIGSLGLLGLVYRGRGHHCVHRLLG